MTINVENTSAQATVRDRTQLAIAETISGRTCFIIGGFGIILALATGEPLGQLAAFEIALTCIMLSGGLSITWSVMRATQAACRERRHELAEDRRERREQHEELMTYLRSIRTLQGKEARVIGDVLSHRRTGRG